jgi:hypothetical protein
MVVIKAAATSFYARPFQCQASIITTSPTKSVSSSSSSSSSQHQHQGLQQDGGRIIRSRLLHRLGIHQKQSPNNSKAEIRCIRKEINYHTNPLLSPYSAPFLQPLRGESITTASMHSSNTISTTIINSNINNNDKNSATIITPDHSKRSIRRRSTIRRIRFDDNVLVVPIPSRHKYSNRIKQAYWRDGKEIQECAERNRYEYASEGWKWESVFEEDEMYVDRSTGELVHPCWIEGYSNNNEEEEDVEEELDEESYHHNHDDEDEEMELVDINEVNDCKEEEEEESSSFFDMDRPMLKRGGSVLPS